jgi:hypothetical protein
LHPVALARAKLYSVEHCGQFRRLAGHTGG